MSATMGGGSVFGMATPHPGGQAGGIASSALGAGQSAGMFSPFGSPAIHAMILRSAMRHAAALRMHGALLGHLAGLNPAEQRQQILDSDANASSGTADALNNAQYGESMHNLDWLHSLLGGRLGAEDSMNQLKEQERFQSQSGGLGSMLGSLAGMGLGAFTGGLGTAAGGALLGAGKKAHP